MLTSRLTWFRKTHASGSRSARSPHNKDIAYLSGVNVPLMISIIFGVACALGAAAGVLIAPINYVQVQMGIGILIKAFAAAVVGGFGSLPGAVLGGLIVGVTESLGAGYSPAPTRTSTPSCS